MKKQIKVVVRDNKLVMSVIEYQPVTTEVGTFDNHKQIAEYMKKEGLKSGDFTDAAKLVIRAQIDTDRQVKEAQFKEKKLKKIEKLEAELRKLKSN